MPENLLEKLLQNQTTDTREKVLSVVHASGLRESDPIFLLMVANSTVQVLLEQAPNNLRQTFNDCLQKTRSEYQGYEQAALTGLKMEIAKAVNQVLTESTAKANQAKNVVTYKSLIGAGAMMLAVLTIGGLCGLGSARWIAQLDGRGLTDEEVKALSWARSKQGRFAYDLMQWNPDLQGRQCQERVKELAVQMGDRKATGGYCFVWIVPYKQRTFAR